MADNGVIADIVMDTMDSMVDGCEHCVLKFAVHEEVGSIDIVRILGPHDAVAASTAVGSSDSHSMVDDDDVLCCPLCRMHMKSTNLKMHLAISHPKQVVWSRALILDDDTSYAVSDGMVNLTVCIHKCYQCGIAFNEQYQMKAHLISVHPVEHLLPAALTRAHSRHSWRWENLATDALSCSLCHESEETFSSTNEVRQHLLSFHCKPLRCHQCSLSFHYKTGLDWHLKVAHRQAAAGVPPTAKLDAIPDDSSSSYVEELLDSDEYTNNCTECPNSYLHPRSLKNHYASDHPAKRWCEFCRQIFSNYSLLMKHLNDDHQNGKISTDGFVKNILPCTKCSARYIDPGKLRGHVREAHLGLTPRCELCSISCRTKFHQEYHELSHKGEFTCGTCSSTFANFRKLKDHLRDYHIPTLYECRCCDKSYTVKKDYLHHFSSQHPNDRIWFCSICSGKGFRSENTYRQHIQRHAGVTNFACDVCGKRFLDHKGLRSHIVIHSDKRPFLCDICGMGFRSKTAHRAHRVRLHAGTSKPPAPKATFQCEVCGKQFTRKRLKVHQEYHENPKYKCSTCGKLFHTATNLSQHSRCHSDIRPHACPTCGARFKLPNHLRNHKRRHTGEPDPYGRSK